MAVDRQHLRQISQNAVGVIGAVAAAVGIAVPANRIRTIYFMKLMHNGPLSAIMTLYRDGAAGAVIMDTVQVPGFQAAGQTGEPYSLQGKDIETPVYILREGEQVGGLIPAGVGYVFFSFYDEEG